MSVEVQGWGVRLRCEVQRYEEGHGKNVRVRARVRALELGVGLR